MSVGEGKEGKGVVKFQERFELNSFFNATFLAIKETQDKKQNTLALGRRKKTAVWGTDVEGDIMNSLLLYSSLGC